jgi:hypothetical protein
LVSSRLAFSMRPIIPQGFCLVEKKDFTALIKKSTFAGFRNQKILVVSVGNGRERL